ncbi:MAG: hypothetical protein ACRDHS_15390 [Actinomycetota bacterium]
MFDSRLAGVGFGRMLVVGERDTDGERWLRVQLASARTVRRRGLARSTCAWSRGTTSSWWTYRSGPVYNEGMKLLR